MRKQIVDHNFRSVTSVSHGWLDFQRLAQVELTSEDADHPIEAALSLEGGQRWRATEGGEQLVRFVFDDVQHIRRIQLLFDERQRARTQEFVLRWLRIGSSPTGKSFVSNTISAHRAWFENLKITPLILSA